MGVKKSDLKEQALYIGVVMLAASMFQLNSTMKSHIEDCSKKSALVVKILGGVAIMVMGELIMKAIGMFQLSHGG